MDDTKQPREVKEALALLGKFYGLDKVGDPDRYLLKKEFRDDAYRMIVFQFHLAIEELLKAHLYRALSSHRTVTAKKKTKDIEGLSSRQAIDWAARLGILTKDAYKALIELNRVRNACSHNWTLHSYKMAKISKGVRKRKYTVEFSGKNLLTPKVMTDEFIPLYSDIYLEFWKAYYL